MMKVLITRPREPSEQLASKLAGIGIASIVMPLYTFVPQQPGFDLHPALYESRGRKLAVFTSPRAVKFGLEYIPAEFLRKLEVAAIGSATRTQLEDSGVKVQLQADTGFTSEDLLQLPGLRTEPGNAFIFCAPGGREKLANGLRELGWAVSRVMVYQRQPLPPAQELINELIATEDLLSVWTSVSAFELASKYLPPEARDKILTAPALVISARIKHHLQQAGATRVAVAEGPGNAGLFQSIQAQLSNHG